MQLGDDRIAHRQLSQYGVGTSDEPQVAEFEINIEGEIVAAISWRDPTSYWKAD